MSSCLIKLINFKLFQCFKNCKSFIVILLYEYVYEYVCACVGHILKKIKKSQNWKNGKSEIFAILESHKKISPEQILAWDFHEKWTKNMVYWMNGID